MSQRSNTDAARHIASSPGAPAPGDAAARKDASAQLADDAREGVAQDAQARAAGNAAADAAGELVAQDAEASEVQGDLDELLRTAAQRDEYLALAQRTQADFENYRKRIAREAQAAQERGVAGLARELLPALDNLDRALGAASAEDPLLEGVRLVRTELNAALARMGVESYSPLGETFDPAVHEAMATAEQPAEGGSQSGCVVEVYQPGYRLGANVIRPARVVVAA